MSAAMLFQAWADTLVTTALLVLAVLLIRKPFARHFGPRLTYALWAVPALRLVLPPLPFAEPVAPQAAAPVADIVLVDMAGAAGTSTPALPVSQAAPLWSFADLLPWLFALWAAGLVAVIATAMLSHQRFRRAVLTGAVALEPIGTIRLVMSEAVDGPVAFGLWHRYVAVPRDFFARYVAEERALAIDHELAHHRHGDLWANSAALLLLAVQWFNPFAWRAIRAFRFDQEAACDARVLTMSDVAPRDVRTARYATAIAKAAVGSRLSLAAPMAVHDNLQERLTMLMQQDISKERGLVGRLLVGGTALAALATTATLVPAGIASASVQDSDLPAPPPPPAPPAPPAAPDAPPPPEAPAAPDAIGDGHGVMIFTSNDDGAGTDAARHGKRREVRSIMIRERDGETPAHVTMVAPGEAGAKRFEFRMPGSLSRDDILATLKEQGIAGAQAEAIADKLEAKRKESFRTALAPIPPMPPIPPMSWSPGDGKALSVAHCGKGAVPVPLVDRDDKDGARHSRVMMIRCGAPGDRTAQLSALKKARAQFSEAQAGRQMSDAMRAKVAADLDRAIAELEKKHD
jgi:beta-lactamase regulating signal transducer with metallopeptidase domain